MFAQIQEKRSQWKAMSEGLQGDQDDVKSALESLYYRVFGSDPVQSEKKAHADVDLAVFERVAELDVSLPALKAEVVKLKSDSHDALVDYWAEKLRLRSEAILKEFGPNAATTVASAQAHGEDYITTVTENLSTLSVTLADAGKKLPAVHQKSQTIRRAVVERGEKRKAPSVTEQVIEEERMRKRPKSDEPGVGGS